MTVGNKAFRAYTITPHLEPEADRPPPYLQLQIGVVTHCIIFCMIQHCELI